MNRTGKDLLESFESLRVSFDGATNAADHFGKVMHHVKRTYWKILLVNLVIGLVVTALTVSVIGGVILGLLKLFGVI